MGSYSCGRTYGRSLIRICSDYRKAKKHHIRNPHYEMLYCNESETDMIKWNSKYKQKVFEISASDEFSKKAELRTKQVGIHE